MKMIHVEATRVVAAPPEQVWAVLRDYRETHPAILPKPYFERLEVEQGGFGAGTIVRVWMNVMGARREYRLAVSEPEPGRVLKEVDPQAGMETTFTVEPVAGGQQTRVTIASDSRPSAGIAGTLERLASPPITRRIYRAELENLDEHIKT